MSPHGRTVQGGGVYLYRLLKTAEILRASSRPGRCDENFRDGSVCGASFCRLAQLFAFLPFIKSTLDYLAKVYDSLRLGLY